MSESNGVTLRKRVARHDDDLRSVFGQLEDIRNGLETITRAVVELQALQREAQVVSAKILGKVEGIAAALEKEGQ